MQGGRVVTATVVATLAFVAYTQALLPGVDLGDSGAFQAAVLWPRTSARQAYPLYFGLARPFVDGLTPGNPARGLNLFSAVAAAAAVWLLTWCVAGVARSALAGAIAGLLLAFSYTFWTQAVIAEVYTLHLALIGLCFAALGWYARRPSTGRFAVFCAAYAIGFGNHLSMILLLVPCAAFLLVAHPRPRELLAPRTVSMAVLIAAAGALLYVPNLLALWSLPEAPPSVAGMLAAFWFDTTKSDWRATMVFGVHASSLTERAAMWAWDARQQFGIAGLAAAAVGGVRLWWISRPWAALVWLGFVACSLFALTYNVGDAHVFFLPGHLLTAFAAGCAFAMPGSSGEGAARPRGRAAPVAAAAALVMVAYAGWRAWDTWPAADRHQDHRGETFVERLLLGADEQQALVVSGLAWDQENALLYAARHMRPNVAWVKLFDVMPHFPFLVADNLGIRRDVVLTADAAAAVVGAFGDAFPLALDEVPPAPRLADVAARLPRGTPYVMTLLTPIEVHDRDPAAADRALRALTGGRVSAAEPVAYEAIAGVVGEPPSLRQRSARPFRIESRLLGDPLTIRMDAWLPQDTFRRGGFGHVMRERERVLFVERGISLVWFAADGRPEVLYESGLYAPQPRFRIPASVARLAVGSGRELSVSSRSGPAPGPEREETDNSRPDPTATTRVLR